MSANLPSDPGPSQVRPVQVHELASEAVQAAGNGGSNGSSDTPVRPRKRPRRPTTWKKAVAKVKRARGEAYVSPSSGKLVPERSTGPSCRCRNKCFDLFSHEEKQAIIRDFNMTAEKQLQDAHLFGLIKSKEVVRRRPRLSGGKGNAPRRATYTYYVSVLNRYYKLFTSHLLWAM